MGLDMYLYAERTYPAGDPTAQAVIAKLGERERTAYDDEDSYYLSMWLHTPEAEREVNHAVLELAFLEAFVTDASGGGHVTFNEDGSTSVAVTCAYWRKANAIHAWFVRECQGGVDECQVSDPIDAEHLLSLVALCRKERTAYDDKDPRAGTILAPQPGFFFGGYDIDEWWAADMTETADRLEAVLKLAAATPGAITFRYHSSW